VLPTFDAPACSWRGW